MTCMYAEFIATDTQLPYVKSLHIRCNHENGTNNSQDALIAATKRLPITIDKLSFASCKLQDVKALDFGNVKVVLELSVSGTALRSVDFQEFESSLCGLERLSLTNNSNLTKLMNNNAENFKQAYNCGNPFSNFKELVLSDNNLQDIQPGFFSNITNLRTLNLEGNVLTELDDEIFKPLSLLENLILTNNPLIKLPILLLPNLHTLSLHGCFLTKVNDTRFLHLSQLRYLDLSGNLFLTSVPGLQPLTSLTHLNISQLPQINPISLGSFPPTLEILDLSNNGLTNLEAFSFKKIYETSDPKFVK